MRKEIVILLLLLKKLPFFVRQPLVSVKNVTTNFKIYDVQCRSCVKVHFNGLNSIAKIRILHQIL